MKLSLSVIIPVYNVEKYLSKCLDSVLVDNEFTGQVVCVNDGSTDGSAAILDVYAEKYPNIEIITQKNSGLSAARNAGLDRATGDYVFFLDSDDWVMPGSNKKVMNHIEGEDVIYFNAKKYYETTQTYDGDCAIEELRHMDGQAYFAAIYGQPRNMPCVCVCGGFYRRLFLKENHLYNEPRIYHEDNYFTPQVLLAAKNVSSINEYVYVYRVREGSITDSVTKKHIEDMLFIARNLYAKYAEQGNVQQVFYADLCGIYISLVENGYRHSIPVGRYWRKADSRIMLRGADNARSRKIAKLTFVHPYVAYRYMIDALPDIWRRMINVVF